MDLMGVGTAEILMILLVAMLVVGPRRMVDLAKTMGKITRTIKKASFDLTSSITNELELEDKQKNPASQTEKKDNKKVNSG